MEAFGRTLIDGASIIEMNIRFPGQYYDQETGLHYNYFRYYESETGRYITAEPIGLLGMLERSASSGIDGGSNLFTYAVNNPIGYFDPDGEWIGVVALIATIAVPSLITYIVVDCINDCKNEMAKNCDIGEGESAINIVSKCTDRCAPFLSFLGFNTPKNLAVTAGKKAGEAAGKSK
jgi:RHS repeat-associated protein